MSLQHLKFDAITESELLRLVTDRAEESKTLEYKQALLLATDGDKREFLSDVTALANTDGGDLVLGISAENGVAAELVGLNNLVSDDVIGRIENLLRDFIQPRLAGVQIKALELTNGNHVLLLRMPRSFSAPHMVRHSGITRFCGRNSNGKYDLDAHELRSAFLASETFSDRLKTFRLERINRLLSGNAPIQLSGPHLIVFHLLPVIGARPDTQLATSSLEGLISTHMPHPIGSTGFNRRFNFDGLLFYSQLRANISRAYVQITRSGFLEAVESEILGPTDLPLGIVLPEKTIPDIFWEQKIIEVMPSYLKALAELKLPPPYLASLSLLNVRDYVMYVGPGRYAGGSHPVDREHLLTNEILIESTTESPDRLLRPLFDQVWNACGWSGSPNYDTNGNWAQK